MQSHLLRETTATVVGANLPSNQQQITQTAYDAFGALIPVIVGRETVGQLETVTEGVPAAA